jgi:ANTAR domain
MAGELRSVVTGPADRLRTARPDPGDSPASALAREFEALSRELRGSGDVVAAMQELARLAVRCVPGCTWSSVVEIGRPRVIRVVAATDPVARHVSQLERSLKQGPVIDLLHGADPAPAPDLAGERRWPALRARLLTDTAVRSLRCVVLSRAPRVIALLMYGNRPWRPDEAADAPAAVFTTHARTLQTLADAEDKIANLGTALDTSRTIGMALGILMMSRKLTAEQAMELLRVTSQHRHVKVRDLAAEVAETGALPVPPELMVSLIDAAQLDR